MESNAKPQRKHPPRRDRRRTKTVRHLQKWIGRQGRNLSGEFLRGAAYKLGSGAVTLIILWWQTRR
ncbi:hypothetical protein GCM10009564_53240 [Streptomyces thermogriseus]|uniref:Uncharacterized protein n=1 Tax=Streptomyces thermogriseus TaxID=75292 RepID=A0ABN1T6J4_9ACTN